VTEFGYILELDGLTCVGDQNCCSVAFQCVGGDGVCHSDDDCQSDLVCGNGNCDKTGLMFFNDSDSCCRQPGLLHNLS
jgi:hypothetical protein